MTHITVLGRIPDHLDADAVETIRLAPPVAGGDVRPLIIDGAVLVTICHATDFEREWIDAAGEYVAHLVGHHRGHAGGYGRTPRAAVQALLAAREQVLA